MKILGRHLIVEYSDCDQSILNNLEQLEKHLNESVRKAGATIVKSSFHRYNPQGVSGVVVIAESHISIHTWPEYGYAAVDFFTVPTVRFQILYCFIVLRHHRRRIVHFNITMHPTARWTAQQITEAFPYDTVPKYLIRDRDGIYGDFFQLRLKNMDIEEVRIAPKSPWQNPYCERVIGSIRRECLNHCIILSENHLCRILKDYMDYYNNCRTHLSLDRNSPSLRDIEPPSKGKVISIPQVGGLHHVYKRVA